MADTSDPAPGKSAAERGGALASVSGGKVKTPVGDAPVIPLFLLGSGMYLAWFLGVHYWRSDTKWPTDPIKAVLQGRGLPGAAATPTEDEQAVMKGAQAQQAQANAIVGTALAPVTGDVTAHPGSAQNQQIGKLQAAAYGWGSGQQWTDLVQLWNRESGWNNTAENPSSGAYGIPQALPYSKMPKAAWPPRYGGRADPTAQIGWGLAYIKGRYGSPSAAWAHEGSAGWY